MKLLWGYSVLAMLMTTIVCFSAPIFPPEKVSTEQQIIDTVTGGIMFIPVFIFVVLVGIRNFRS